MGEGENTQQRDRYTVLWLEPIPVLVRHGNPGAAGIFYRDCCDGGARPQRFSRLANAGRYVRPYLSFRLPLLGRCVDFRRTIQQCIKDPARQTMTVLFAFELYERVALGFFPGRRKPR